MRRHIITFLAFSSVILSGCIFPLQENPVLDVDSLHISCTANPEIVDGDLGTESILQSEPGVARGGAGVLIGLDEATYIKHVEVYAASRMRDVRIYVAAEEPRGNAGVVFEPIRDYYTNNSGVIDSGQMKRFRIDREVLYLKLLTGWTVDYTSGKKIEKSLTLGYNRVLPMVGPMVREVKFYTVGGAPTPHRIADNDEDGHSTLPKTNVGKDGALMVLIPEGEFQMGGDNVRPVETVYLDTFYMDKYAVSNAQYKKFMDATGHNAPGFWNDPNYNAPDHPVVGVSWHNTVAYAEWAGKRLPTDAEWEKAARGGLSRKLYPWGNKQPNGTQCNFADRNTDWDFSSSNIDDGYKYTAPVNAYSANGYGLLNMVGNVWEWCADWDDKDYQKRSPYKKATQHNPTGPTSGEGRVLRGGSWAWSLPTMRITSRWAFSPDGNTGIIGFRCVKDIPR